MPAVHILQGRPENYERLIRSTARRRGDLIWTVPSHARAGDSAVFYLPSPVSAFVAAGTITEDAWRDDSPGPWSGRYGAAIRDVRPLPRDITLLAMRARFPAWAYLRSAQGTVTVPSKIASRVLRYVLNPGPIPRDRSSF